MKRFSDLAIPYIVWAVIMLFLPVLLLVFYAFTNSGNGMVSFTLTLEHFAKFFTDTDFLQVTGKSIMIAIKTTLLCVFLGYPVAYFIANSDEKTRGILILAITLPMWINMLVRTYAWIGILTEGGIVSRIIKVFTGKDYEVLYTEAAVLIGMVYNFLPFMILQVNTSLCKLDKSLLDAANDLGANAFERFIKVTLPLSVPGIVSGISLVFLPAVSSFFIPKLLGGGQYFLIGNVIENQFITVGEWNFGSAISMIMAVIMMLTMYVVRRAEDKVSGKEETANEKR
ncbi:MAG: ABC transporter permease [Eubacteriales bacterium]|nr:ABC transporter permease [Eubacteriales bacterium]